MSDKAHSLLATPDRIILRLNKLLAAPGGLSAFLSTFNYTLYLLAHLETKLSPLKTQLALLINRSASTPKITPVVPAGPSSIAALSSVLSQTRTTLRLFGLLPLYAWGRQLLRGPKRGEDGVLYATAATQCALYIVFQALENAAFLIDAKVLPAALTGRADGKTARMYLWSYRMWMLGVACDVVRLAREAQLERGARSRRSAPEKKDIDIQDRDVLVDQKWWSELIVPLAWLPVAVHFAEWNKGGLPGFNLGVMGLCGGVAGLGKMRALWHATADL